MARRVVQIQGEQKNGYQLSYLSFCASTSLKTSTVLMRLVCMTPDGSLWCSFEQLNDSKKAMDTITFLYFVNTTDSDKLKFLVISKSRKLRCLRDINLDALSVTYCSNNNAWMTSTV